ERLAGLLADGFLPPEGDLLTAVNTFLFRTGGRTVLVDAGAGRSSGPAWRAADRASGDALRPSCPRRGAQAQDAPPGRRRAAPGPARRPRAARCPHRGRSRA